MERWKTTQELLDWIASLTPKERKRVADEAWEKIERLRDNIGPELTEAEWDELDAWYNARMTSAAAHRS